MIVDREELLKQLEAASPGLATREVHEQSSCYVFRGGRVYTFNDEIAVSAKCCLGIEGAVAAAKMVELLGKMPENMLDISPAPDKANLNIKGQGRRAQVRMEAEIALPLSLVDVPEDWQELPPMFADAVMLAASCAVKKDDENYQLACVHITPTFVEACDNFQLLRYPLDTPLAAPVLVRREVIRHVYGLDMTEVCVTASWIHFRNPAGLQLACRVWKDSYSDLSGIMRFDGIRSTIPAGLTEAAQRAQVFSSEQAKNDKIRISLKPGSMDIIGQGASGRYQERKEVDYKGDPLDFLIPAEILISLGERAWHECEIGPGKLRVQTGAFTYVSCLGKPGDPQ